MKRKKKGKQLEIPARMLLQFYFYTLLFYKIPARARNNIKKV